MSKDTIYRRDAIDALSCENPTEIYVFYDDAVKAIRRLPSAERKGEWIPCSERLPEKGDVVLITNAKGNVKHGQYRGVDFVANGNYYWWWKKNTSECVKAWMPLPEPYQGGER